jgi:hypothetical protein
MFLQDILNWILFVDDILYPSALSVFVTIPLFQTAFTCSILKMPVDCNAVQSSHKCARASEQRTSSRFIRAWTPAPSPPWVPSDFRSGLSFFVWDLAEYQLSHGSSADRKRSSRAAVADSGC